MSRHSAQHRRHGSPYIRLGASILIPALVATSTYVLLNDSSEPRTTTTGDPDLYPPPTVFTGPATTEPTTEAETKPPSQTPSPTPSATDGNADEPATTQGDSPEPSDESPPSTSGADEPADDSTSSDPDPDTSDPTTDPPEPSESPDEDRNDKIRRTKLRVELSRAEASMVDEINDDRADAGCPAVKPHVALMEAARAHSADMVKERFESTQGSDGSSPQKRAYRAGYTGTVTEIVFSGVGWASIDVGLGLRSEERAVITDCSYESIGIGAAKRALETKWTLDFGTS